MWKWHDDDDDGDDVDALFTAIDEKEEEVYMYYTHHQLTCHAQG
jgi:hypothetical protein